MKQSSMQTLRWEQDRRHLSPSQLSTLFDFYCPPVRDLSFFRNVREPLTDKEETMMNESLDELDTVIQETLQELAGQSPHGDFVTEEDVEKWERDRRQRREVCFHKLLSAKLALGATVRHHT